MVHLSGRILITGGAGFLGRAIIRRAQAQNWPCEFTVYSRDEEKQFRLRRRWPEVHCILGDVRDRERLTQSMAYHDVVIHAAAVKFIPEAEQNVAEAIAVNVGGSDNVIAAALHWRGRLWGSTGVVKPKTVVGISTDKAVLPVNTYGATKMLMERMFARASALPFLGNDATPYFVTVRYGNVVGSTGSIIPVFEHQLETTGKVQVTNPMMTRFWLSADDAVDLIALAVETAHGRPGAVFVPKCKAMSIGELAEMIAGDQVEIIGERPGEKQHETLIHYQESVLAEDWGAHCILHPQTSQVKTASPKKEPWTYPSQHAERLTAEEMQAMIEDAKDLDI